MLILDGYVVCDYNVFTTQSELALVINEEEQIFLYCLSMYDHTCSAQNLNAKNPSDI